MQIQHVWWLTKHELKTRWLSILLTVVGTVFFGIIAGSLMHDYIGRGNAFWSHDFVFIFCISSLGSLFVSKEYTSWGTIREEPFLKRQAFFRSLPIPLKVLARGRMLFTLIVLLIMSIVFWSTAYIVLWGMDSSLLNMFDPIYFTLFWFGFALIFSGLVPFMEFGMRAKVWMVMYFFSAFIIIFIVIGFYLLTGMWIFEVAFTAVNMYGVWPGIVTVACGAVSCAVWVRLLEKKMSTIDLP
jgi:MFS family permease